MKLLVLMVVACLSSLAGAADDDAMRKPAQPGAVKRGAKKAAADIKQGFIEYKNTLKRTGKKLGKHVADSARRDKEKIKQDFQRLKDPDK